MRTDLKKSSPAVQAGHAVAQFMLEYPDSGWDNQYLIYLRVRSEDELNAWKSKLGHDVQLKKMLFSNFREPDLDGELTAIAVSGIDGSFFKTLRLL